MLPQRSGHAGLELETKVTLPDRELRTLCPAGATIKETVTGSAVMCRITGNLVTTGENPSSLAAHCLCPLAYARGEGSDGSPVRIGYQGCPIWRHNRDRELEGKRDEMFISRATT